MRRRAFVTAAVAVGLARAGAARAQAPTRKTVGLLMASADDDADGRARHATFTSRMAELGWKEGASVRYELRWAAGRVDLFASLAKELAGLKPDAILADATPSTLALQKVTSTIPVVFCRVTDPVGQGIIKSLARPEGNITGFTNYEAAFGSKWLEILSEIAPGIAHTCFIYNPQTAPYSGPFLEAIQEAGRIKGIAVADCPVRSTADIEAVIAAEGREARSSLIVQADSFVTNHRELIINAASRHRLPGIYPTKPFAQAGGLAFYGHNPLTMYRDAAGYIDRMLKGARPADLPTQAPTRFELVINMRSAHAIGLEVPPMMLARADEVIE